MNEVILECSPYNILTSWLEYYKSSHKFTHFVSNIDRKLYWIINTYLARYYIPNLDNVALRSAGETDRETDRLREIQID